MDRALRSYPDKYQLILNVFNRLRELKSSCLTSSQKEFPSRIKKYRKPVNGPPFFFVLSNTIELKLDLRFFFAGNKRLTKCTYTL